MSEINFEEDQTKSISLANDAKELSDQVIKLKNLEDQITSTEDNLKNLKKQADLISGLVDIHSLLQGLHNCSPCYLRCDQKKR